MRFLSYFIVAVAAMTLGNLTMWAALRHAPAAVPIAALLAVETELAEQAGAGDADRKLLDAMLVVARAPDERAEVLRRSTAAWGTVYGIASLARAHKIPAVVDADRTRLLHDAVEALRDAWQADGAQHQAPPG